MKMLMAVLAVSVLALGGMALAERPENPGRDGQCVAAGVGTLVQLDLIVDAAKQQIDYSSLADPVDGPIFADLPAGSNLKLKDVIQLHLDSPELFSWCN